MKKTMCLLTVLLMCAVSFGKTNENAEKQENKVYIIGNGNFGKVEIIKTVLETEKKVIIVGLEKGITFDVKFLQFQKLLLSLNYENLFIDTGGTYRQDFIIIDNESNKPNQFYSYKYSPPLYKKVSDKSLHYRKSRYAI